MAPDWEHYLTTLSFLLCGNTYLKSSLNNKQQKILFYVAEGWLCKIENTMNTMKQLERK